MMFLRVLRSGVPGSRSRWGRSCLRTEMFTHRRGRAYPAGGAAGSDRASPFIAWVMIADRYFSTEKLLGDHASLIGSRRSLVPRRVGSSGRSIDRHVHGIAIRHSHALLTNADSWPDQHTCLSHHDADFGEAVGAPSAGSVSGHRGRAVDLRGTPADVVISQHRAAQNARARHVLSLGRLRCLDGCVQLLHCLTRRRRSQPRTARLSPCEMR